MIGLRVECRLAGPWVPPAFGLHLDGLLAWARVQECLQQGAEAGEPDYENILASLPLQRDPATSAWCASLFATVGWAGQERRYLTAKTPVEAMCREIIAGSLEAKGGAKIDTVRGLAKNGQAFFTAEHAQGLRAWCVGDPDDIVHLLTSFVHGVGQKTRSGFGSMIEGPDGSCWTVVEDEEAHQKWRYRSMPVATDGAAFQAPNSGAGLGDGILVPGVGSWKPPYWAGQEMVWRPLPVRLAADAVHV